MRSDSIALCLAAALLLPACGYRFTAGGGELKGGARTLFVPLFANRTLEPEVDAYFTAALRQELAREGREGGEGSDVRVEGVVSQVGNGTSISVNKPLQQGLLPTPRISAFRITATAVVKTLRGTQKLDETIVTGSEDYAPGFNCTDGVTAYQTANAGCVLELEANRRTALRRLAAALMRQAYDNLAAGL